MGRADLPGRSDPVGRRNEIAKRLTEIILDGAKSGDLRTARAVTTRDEKMIVEGLTGIPLWSGR